jgi:L-lactate dehydrogenase complex protein LldF
VLSPILFGDKFPEYADLPKASSLCGACNEVCPVDIPIPDLLLRLRDQAKRLHIFSPGAPPLTGFSTLATSPKLWRSAMRLSPLGNRVPLEEIPIRPLSDWCNQRTLPEFRGGAFRKWMNERDSK